jgi:hypothetical protein
MVMTRRSRQFAVATLVGAATLAHAEPTVCTLQGDQRSVEVVYSGEAGGVPCEVIYSKRAESSSASIYRANHEVGYCEARAAEFVDALRGWGWQCAAPEPAPPVAPDS